jgi:acyl-[acyl-carrier-protein]-phospholipid O-acyltransferase/long-chain-fatty-acid--[acyl-carrier-protein] ligase
MKSIYKISGFLPYFLIVFLNASVDIGHKIILQNTVFKVHDGMDLMVLTAVINALILLPFLLLFSPSGFISDKFCKVRVVRVASFVAIIITSFITLSYYLGWFEMAFIATLLLAAQSAIYSPAKYGLIKEIFGKNHIVTANSWVQSITIVAILLGSLVYSLLFEDLLPNEVLNKDEILTYMMPIGFVLIASSIVEFLLAFKLSKTSAEQISQAFSFKKYLSGRYFKDNNQLIKRNTTIWHAVLGLGIIWAISQIVLATFGAFLKSSAGVDNTVVVQALLAMSGVGMIVGSYIASRASKNHIETGIIPLGSLGIAITLFFLVDMQNTTYIAAMFFAYGVSAGLIIVPLNALIQFNASKEALGRILAGSNFYQNIFMFLGLSLSVVLSYQQFNSTDIITIAAWIGVVGVVWTLVKLPQSLIIYLVRFVFRLRYKIYETGLENTPNNKGVLLLGNHVSYIDWMILQVVYPRQIRFVMEKSIYKKWYLRGFLNFFKIIPISSGGSKNALKEVENALNNGDTVALFPEGMLTRNGQVNKFLAGFELALREAKDTVIVPFYLHGLWESRFSNANDLTKQGEDIYVKFGTPLSSGAPAALVQEKVQDLGVEIWQDYSQNQGDIASLWVNKIKQKNQFFVADSTGVKLNSKQFLAGTLLMRKWLKTPLMQAENVGCILPSSVAGSLCNMALFCLGKVVVNLNYTTHIDILKATTEKAGIQQIITSKKFVKKLTNKGFDITSLQDSVHFIYLEDMKDFANKARKMKYFLLGILLPVSILKMLFIQKKSPTDNAVILFSSGSEGTPKGIVLSHQNIIANVKQVKTLINPTKRDRIMGTLPIFHSFGLTICTLLPQLEGIAVVYHPDPTDGFAIGKLVSQYKASIMLGTATFLRLYLRNRKLTPLMLESIRLVVAGAERLPKETREGFRQKFGLDIFEGYGATETAPVASCNVPDALVPGFWKVQMGQKHGTIGKPLVGTKIIITHPETFERLKTSEAGMILIAGAQVMKGYYQDDEKTRSVIQVIDGKRYYVTGDKGKIDQDGFVTIVDRYSRFVKIGAEMVSLSALEAQITQHLDSSIEVAASGLPDSKKGEKVVLLFSGDITPEDLKQTLLTAKINPLYLPSAYYQVDSLPKLGTGKPDFNGIKALTLEVSS